jgi:hypothetical protein
MEGLQVAGIIFVYLLRPSFRGRPDLDALHFPPVQEGIIA